MKSRMPVPIGTVLPYAGKVYEPGDSPPRKTSDVVYIVANPWQRALHDQGWLLCDGRYLLVAGYAELFRVIGYLYGKQGEGKFNLPDYRGRFLRGVDHNAGVDPDAGQRSAPPAGSTRGDAVGSLQADMFQIHRHTYVQAISSAGRGLGEGLNLDNPKALTGDPTGDDVRSGRETRPKNVYVNFIICYTSGLALL